MNVAVGPPAAAAAPVPGGTKADARPRAGKGGPAFAKVLSGALEGNTAERPGDAAPARPAGAGPERPGPRKAAGGGDRHAEAAAGAAAALMSQPAAPVETAAPAAVPALAGAGSDAGAEAGGEAGGAHAGHAAASSSGADVAVAPDVDAAVDALADAEGGARTGRAADAADAAVAAPVLEGLHPTFRSRLERVRARMAAEFGHRVEVVEGYRDQARQDALYAQGRTSAGPVVTWTRDSLHTAGRAADVRIDGSYENAEAYERLAQIAREEGLRTLGPRDAGHIELPRDAAAGAHAGGGKQAAAGAGVARVARVAEVASVAPVARPAEPVVAMPAAVAAPGGAAAANPDAAAPVEGPVPAGLEAVARASEVLEVAGAAAARPRSHVLLDVQDAAGNPTRIRVDLRGPALAATIDAADPAAAEQLAARIGELHRALERHGIENSQVRVRSYAQPVAEAVRAAGGAESIAPGAAVLTPRAEAAAERRPATDTPNQQGTRDPGADPQRSRREQRQERSS